MKIAITGSTAGIGLALSNVFASKGHDIIGLSRRIGYNIRSTQKIVNAIKDCDLFINNAQEGYAQTELLFEIFKQWQSLPNKNIWVISTDLVRSSAPRELPGHSKLQVLQYKNQKSALEESCRQLQSLNLVNILIIRPGAIATQPDQQGGIFPYCDVTNWAETLVETVLDLDRKGYNLKEFSLTANKYPYYQ